MPINAFNYDINNFNWLQLFVIIWFRIGRVHSLNIHSQTLNNLKLPFHNYIADNF